MCQNGLPIRTKIVFSKTQTRNQVTGSTKKTIQIGFWNQNRFHKQRIGILTSSRNNVSA